MKDLSDSKEIEEKLKEKLSQDKVIEDITQDGTKPQNPYIHKDLMMKILMTSKGNLT